jgi:peptidoglycan/LPS O-acetylase OafA/YrhL
MWGRCVGYLYPQVIFYSLASLLFLRFYPGSPALDWFDWFFGLVAGSTYRAAAMSGLGELWFLPAFLGFSLLASCYLAVGRVWRVAIVSGCMLLVVICAYLPDPSMLPFGFPIAVFMLPVAVVTTGVASWLGPRVSMRWITFGSALVLAVLAPLTFDSKFNIGALRLWSPGNPQSLAVHVPFMIGGYVLACSIGRLLADSATLSFIGRRSLEIYLVHHFIDVLMINVLLDAIYGQLGWLSQLVVGGGVFLLALLGSMAVALLVERGAFVKVLFRPPTLMVVKDQQLR